MMPEKNLEARLLERTTDQALALIATEIETIQTYLKQAHKGAGNNIRVAVKIQELTAGLTQSVLDLQGKMQASEDAMNLMEKAISENEQTFNAINELAVENADAISENKRVLLDHMRDSDGS